MSRADRATIEAWLADERAVAPGSACVTMRNRDSWGSGGFASFAVAALFYALIASGIAIVGWSQD